MLCKARKSSIKTSPSLYLLLQLMGINLSMRKIPLVQLPLSWLYLHS